ncbi:uncharacterized protein LOC128984903 [Macrosteles quadrilineatus]|uniref:uncharacterized protein LOC128984903 n=1 Tax=Macrosteles quadrilineatus TaxID=74068 RepID=UPI0023E179F5|nr:uncharacterized protein LOC128984903 [Macrosteles quadrilineatus]
MLKPSTYGSACELIAASEFFHCIFRVYHDGHLLQSFGVEGTATEYHILFSGNLSSGHFDVLEPTHNTENDHDSSTKFNIVLENNHQKAPEIPPKPYRKAVSQCTENEGVNFEYSIEQSKAKRLKQIATSQPVETSIRISHIRDILHDEKELGLLEHVNQKTNNFQSYDSYTENIEQPENTAKQDKLKSKKKRTKRKGQFSNAPRSKQLRDAAAKYKITHPEVNRAAVAKYTQQNPEVNLAAVAKYTQQNPEVNRAAVAKYTQQNPEVNRAAVAKYTQQNPEAHRLAVAKYTKNKPEVNRAAVSKYDKNHEKRQQRKNKTWSANANSGFQYDPNICYESDKIISLGPMEVLCNHCKALKWKNESNGLCCDNGKVCINRLEKRPEPLHSLIVGGHPESEHFLSNSRKYNSAFQMTSFGAKQIYESGFMPTFKVQGQVYHLIGSLLPSSNNDDHQFLQLYFIGDDNKETTARCDKVPGIKPALVHMIQNMLHNFNTYVMDFKCAIENMSEDSSEFQVLIHADKKPTNAHRGRYNAPVSGEVGAVVVGQEFGKRDILIKSRDNKLQRISETHRAYDALQYPLMFCYGEDGYSISISQYDPVTKTHLQKTVSAASYYCFRLMVLSEEINYLHYFRGLLNQFMVDMYAKIETERLNFIRNNQKKLRAENYVHLKDAVGKGDTNPEDLGQAVILPSTFTGGARYMHKRTQDAMTYVRHYGRPDLFITFTCNPKWDEITENLFDGQKPQDRHDLISRVFHLKVKSMINLLTKVGIFGPSLCFMYTIEWQKRGLPHAHILLWLKTKIKPEKIDQVICAEIPDPEADTKLHNIVKSTMIHGPCGDLNKKSPCMVKGLCSKQYPRPLLKETQTGDDGYSKYRRPQMTVDIQSKLAT